MHKRSYWTLMKILTGSINTLRHHPDSDLYNEVPLPDSDQFCTMTGQTSNITGGQEIC